jgi:hypothetical protein
MKPKRCKNCRENPVEVSEHKRKELVKLSCSCHEVSSDNYASAVEIWNREQGKQKRRSKDIIIKVIPHEDRRYSTCGDWYRDKQGRLIITTSELGNPDWEFLVQLHELVEVHLCEKAGITDAEVVKFDVEFEKNRKPGNNDEPGDDPKAPYGPMHHAADAIEMVASALLGVNQHDYAEKLNSLP